METLRFVVGEVGVVEVAVLSLGSASASVLVMVAVLTRSPVRAASTRPATVNVTDSPGARLPSAHVVSEQTHPCAVVAIVAPLTPAGVASLIVTDVAVEAPLLVAVSVQVALSPGMTGLGVAWVLASVRSTLGVAVATAVLVLLSGERSGVDALTVAVLLSTPRKSGSSTPTIVAVTRWPTSWRAVAQVTTWPSIEQGPSPASLVALRILTPSGTTSTMALFTAADGPSFMIWTVQVTSSPGTASPTSDFVTVMSASGVVVTVAVAALLLRSGSGVLVLIRAVFVRSPVAVASSRPEMVTRDVPPAGTKAAVQVSDWDANVHSKSWSLSVVTWMSETSDGTTSVTTLSKAADGPALPRSRTQVTRSPGTASPSTLLATLRSAEPTMGVFEVEALLVVTGSLVGLAALIRLVRVPVVAASSSPVTVKVTLAPGAREAAWQLHRPAVPPSSAHAHPPGPVIRPALIEPGSWSVITGLTAVDGPRFCRVAVHVTGRPGTAGLGVVWDLLTARSAVGAAVVVAVAVSFVGFGSVEVEVTSAELLSVPVNAGSRCPVTVMVPTAPTARDAVVQETSCPAVAQLMPEDDAVTPVMAMAAGTVSVAVIPEATEGPWFVTVRV